MVGLGNMFIKGRLSGVTQAIRLVPISLVVSRLLSFLKRAEVSYSYAPISGASTSLVGTFMFILLVIVLLVAELVKFKDIFKFC